MRLGSLVSLTVLSLTAGAGLSLAQSPYLVRDIYPGGLGSGPSELTDVNGTLFFDAFDGTTGYELWKSDGTAMGTVLVKDIYPGPLWSLHLGSFSGQFTNVNGTLYFAAIDDVANGLELWKSDGTAPGTVMVKDINPTNEGSSFPLQLTSINGTLFFAAEDGTTGRELWKSDGTAAGTVLVKDICPGSGGSFPWELTNVGGMLFFVADDGVHGQELWKSDGTAAGTVLVKDIIPGLSNPIPGELTNVSGTLFFAATDDASGRTLWKSDGTAAGTMRVLPTSNDTVPLSLTDFDGTLFFSADDGTTGRELWKSDGTPAGTALVSDIAAGSSGSFPALLTSVNGTLFFQADDGVSGLEVWKSDGTATGTVRVKDILTGPWGSFPGHFMNANGALFFTAEEPAHGRELWKSDGTETGTVLVADINPGSSYPDGLTAGGPGLFFAAEDALVGRELCALGLPVVTNDDGVALVSVGQVVTYSITIRNPGPPDMSHVVVSDVFPAGLEGVTWTCTPASLASCTGSGAGAISDAVDLPRGTSVTYVATGSVSPTASGLLSNMATVTLQPNFLSYSATDTDVVGAAMDYFTLTPCRLVDTRGTGGSIGGPALQGQETRVYAARGRCGIPATAKAVSLNLTATGSSAAGHVRLFPKDQALPSISTLNYPVGQTRGSNAIVSLDAQGEFAAYVGQPVGTRVDLIVDVTGYFE